MANFESTDGGLRELVLFAGAGGGILASDLLGDRVVCAVERDAYACAVLAQRQNDGALPLFPIWSDIRTFDGRPWRGVVDVVSGGFPCQDISIAGNGDGLEGERSGLWREFVRVVREVEPSVVRVENSPMLTSRGLGEVLGDLAALGFDARWDVLSAEDAGAPHLRERIWIVAYAKAFGSQAGSGRALQRRAVAERQALEPQRCSEAHPNAVGGRREVERQPQHSDQQGEFRLEPDRLRAPGHGGGGRRLPTPLSRDYRHPPANSYEDRGGGGKGDQLPYVAGGPLNPPWVEWLMGWPSEWTALSALETDKYREWRQQHSLCWKPS